jgi:hypothetical protein
VIFQVGKWPLDLIIYLLVLLKCDVGEVDEAMFQGVERPCEINFYLLRIQKKRLVKIRGSDVASRRMALIALYLPPGRLKNYFGEVDKAVFQYVERPLEIIFLYPGHLKKLLGRIRGSEVPNRKWPPENIMCLIGVFMND